MILHYYVMSVHGLLISNDSILNFNIVLHVVECNPQFLCRFEHTEHSNTDHEHLRTVPVIVVDYMIILNFVLLMTTISLYH